MPRVAGHTPEEQYDLGEHFAEVVSYSLATAIDAVVTTMRTNVVTAAAFVSPDDASAFNSQWAYEVDNSLGPFVYQVYESSALAVAYDAAEAYDLKPGAGIPTLEPTTAHEYVAQAKNLLRGVGDDAWRNLRQQIQLGVQNGETIDEIATRVYTSAGVSHARAKAVARTEVNRASNAASFAQARLVGGSTATKEWLAIVDTRTRLDHADADLQKVPINDPFLVGGWHLQFPGDPSAPPGETVNCRCTLVFDFPDEPAASCSLQASAATLGTCVSATGLTDSQATQAPATITEADQALIYYGFMEQAKISPAYGGAKIYKNLQGLKSYLKQVQLPELAELNEWQLLDAIDKEYAKVGGKSSFLSKFDEWIDSTAGKKATGGLTKHVVQEIVAPTSAPTIEHIIAPSSDGIAVETKDALFAKWKSMKPITPGWGGSAIHKQLQALKKDLPSTHPELASLSDEDLLKILDEQFAAKTKSSGTKTYLDEVSKWKATPAGKKQLIKEGSHGVAHAVTSNVAPSLAPSTPPAPVKYTPEDLPGGKIDHLAVHTKNSVWSLVKSNGVYLSSPPEKIMEGVFSLLKSTDEHIKNLTPLQILRILDEKASSFGGTKNEYLYEQKVLTWLKTPQGAAKAEVIKKKALASHHPSGPYVHPTSTSTPTTTPTSTPASAPTTTTAGPKPKPASKKIEDFPTLDRSAIDPNAAHEYDVISGYDAKTMQDAQRPWTPGEKAGLKFYTSNNYTQMNAWLRSNGRTSLSDTAIRHTFAAQNGMRPSIEPMLLKRGTGARQFGATSDYVDKSFFNKLVGKTLEDKGFMSTSVGDRAAFGGSVLLEIEAPPGTPMAYVAPISHYQGEREMLLAAGTRYKVMSVSSHGHQTVVRVRVVP